MGSCRIPFINSTSRTHGHGRNGCSFQRDKREAKIPQKRGGPAALTIESRKGLQWEPKAGNPKNSRKSEHAYLGRYVPSIFSYYILGLPYFGVPILVPALSFLRLTSLHPGLENSWFGPSALKSSRLELPQQMVNHEKENIRLL